MLSRFLQVATGTLASKILGLARDIMIARVFGASSQTDAFFVALQIPNLFRRFFAEGTFSQVFIPVLSEIKQEASPQAVSLYASRIFLLLNFLVVPLCLGIAIFPQFFIGIFAQGFSEDAYKLQLASEMLQIMIFYLLLISIASFFTALLHIHAKFAVASYTPSLMNICLLTSLLFFVPFFSEPIFSLAWAILVSGILQSLLLAIFFSKLGIPLGLVSFKLDANLKKTLRLALPTLWSASAAQVNILYATFLASYLSTGVISWIYYSNRLMEVPIGLIGYSLGIVLMPLFAKLHASKEEQKLHKIAQWGFEIALMLGLYIGCIIVFYSHEIFLLLFSNTAFSSADITAMSLILKIYSLAVLAALINKVLTSFFFAQQQTSIAAKSASFGCLVGIISSSIGFYFFGYLGLAAGNSLTLLSQSLMLIYYWKKLAVHKSNAKFWLCLLFSCLASYGFYRLQLLEFPNSWYARLGWLAFQSGGILAIFLALSKLFGIRIYPHFLRQNP